MTADASETDAARARARVALLSHSSWAERRALVQELSQAGSSTAAVLVESLVSQRSSEPIIAGLVDALAASHAAVEPLVQGLLAHASPAVVCDAIQILGRRRDASSAARLIELAAHEDDNVALAAVEALGRIGGDAAVTCLLALCQGGNFFRVFPAIDALGRCRDERALPALTKFLDQPIYAAEAARALGRLGSLQAVPFLLQAMTRGPEANVVVGAASLVAIDARIAELGPTSAVRRCVREQAEPALRHRLARAMSFADSKEQLALGRVSVWLANATSVDDLLRLLSEGTEDVSSLALQALTELSALGEPRVLQLLQTGSSELRSKLLPHVGGLASASGAISACLLDQQASVRTLACHALAKGSDRGVVPALFQLLKDPDLGVVHAAVGAIQSLGGEETERLALLAARSESLAERRAALRIVTYLGYAQSFELCVEALASSDARLRDVALGALPHLDDARASSVLLQHARHPSARTRAAALRALGSTTTATAEVVAVLEQALDDSDAWARYYACQALGKLHVDEAVPQLLAKLTDTAGQVQMAAIEALARLPGAAATRALADEAVSTDVEQARAAIVGIGERGDAQLLPVLERALESADATIRLVAVSSLARLAGTEPALKHVAQSDTSPAVRSAAIELLASNPSAAATEAMLSLLARASDPQAILGGLAQHLEARVPSLSTALSSADEQLAKQILGVLSRSPLPRARRAIEDALSFDNTHSRRAAARVLSLLLDDAAKALLARAANSDDDAEVRRISTLAIA